MTETERTKPNKNASNTMHINQ